MKRFFALLSVLSVAIGLLAYVGNQKAKADPIYVSIDGLPSDAGCTGLHYPHGFRIYANTPGGYYPQYVTATHCPMAGGEPQDDEYDAEPDTDIVSEADLENDVFAYCVIQSPPFVGDYRITATIHFAGQYGGPGFDASATYTYTVTPQLTCISFSDTMYASKGWSGYGPEISYTDDDHESIYINGIIFSGRGYGHGTSDGGLNNIQTDAYTSVTYSIDQIPAANAVGMTLSAGGHYSIWMSYNCGTSAYDMASVGALLHTYTVRMRVYWTYTNGWGDYTDLNTYTLKFYKSSIGGIEATMSMYGGLGGNWLPVGMNSDSVTSTQPPETCLGD